jgi:hypothetical protein
MPSALAGIWPFLLTIVALLGVTSASEELSGNISYFFQTGVGNIDGVSVTIQFKEDFVSSQNGASFMLNCWATSEGFSLSLMQFYFLMDPSNNDLIAVVEFFNGSSNPLKGVYAYTQTFSQDLQPPQTIPAGTTLSIQLVNQYDYVTGAIFTMTNLGGKSATQTFDFAGTTNDLGSH